MGRCQSARKVSSVAQSDLLGGASEYDERELQDADEQDAQQFDEIKTVFMQSTNKNNPNSLKASTYETYQRAIDVIDTDCVVYWPTAQNAVSDDRKISDDTFESQMKDSLTCTICFNLVTDPWDCLKCDLAVCGECYRRLSAKSKYPCPNRCSSSFKKGHKLVRTLLNSTVVSCPNKLKYSKCVGICEVVLRYEQMKDHLKSQCPYRVEKCEHCPKSDFAKNMILHSLTCPSATAPKNEKLNTQFMMK